MIGQELFEAASSDVRAAVPVGAFASEGADEPRLLQAVVKARQALLLAEQALAPPDLIRQRAGLTVFALTLAGKASAARYDAVATKERFDLAREIAEDRLPAVEIAFLRYEAALALAQSGGGRLSELAAAVEAWVELAETPGGDARHVRALAARADLRQWLGDLVRATADVDRALRMLRNLYAGDPAPAAGDDRQVFLHLLELQAFVAADRGEASTAAALLGRVFSEFEQGGAGPQMRVNLASFLVQAGRFEDAAEHLRSLEEAFKPGSQHFASFLGVRAEARIGLGSTEAALRDLEAALTDPAGRTPDLRWRLLELRARCTGDVRDHLEAARAVACVREPFGHRLEAASFRDKARLFEQAVRVSAANGNAAACAEIIELGKARSLAQLMRSGSPTGSSWSTELAELDDRLDALEFAAHLGRDADADGHDRAALQQRRAELLDRSRLERVVRFAGSTAVEFDLASTIRHLGARGQAAITLHRHERNVTAVLIADGQVDVAVTTLDDTVTAFLDEYRSNLHSPEPDPILAVPWAFGADQLIPVGMLERAATADSLLLCPHGDLHLLPWPALYMGAKRLFERVPVGIVPTLSLVGTVAGAASPPRAVSLFGPPEYAGAKNLKPLPGAQAETGALATTYSGRLLAAPATGQGATESVLRQILVRPDAGGAVLHAACHATMEPGDPLRSGLLAEDGRVDAAELAALDVRYDEIILSACSTGWRPFDVPGDEAIGLPAALLEAGVKAILVSIPLADDATTCRLMQIYYRHRFAGRAPLHALRETQVEMLDHAFLYNFGGFVLYATA